MLGRDNPEVDDGWLCDRGRYGFEMFADAEAGRRAAAAKAARRPSWEDGDRGRGRGPARAPATARSRRSSATPPTRRASWSSGSLREALGSPHVDSRPSRGPGREALVAPRPARALGQGRATSTSADVILVLGTDPLHSSPILDLRIRKAIRRNGARLAVATERPTALDGGAEAIARYAPGEAAHFLGELAAALSAAPRTSPTPLAESLRDAGKVVVVWGERIARDGDGAADALLELADALEHRPSSEGAGLLEIPDFANARGLREAGCLPDAGPGLRARSPSSGIARTEEIRAGAGVAASSSGLILFGVDPLRDFPDTAAWEAALTAADFVVCLLDASRTRPPPRPTSSSRSRPTPRKTAPSPTPTAASSASAPPPAAPATSAPTGRSSPSSPLALGHDTGIDSQPTAFAALTERGPLLRRRSPTPSIGGRGVRWQDTPSGRDRPAGGARRPAPTRRTRLARVSRDTQRRAAASAESVPAPGAPDARLSRSAPTATSGRARSPS